MENNNPQPSKPQDNLPAPVFIPDTMVRQKSHLDKLAEVFLPEDLDSIGNRIVQNVMIPSILKTAGDILVRSIDMIFGTNYSGINNSQPSNTIPGSSTPYTPYSGPQRNTVAASQATGTTTIVPVRSAVYEYADVRWKSSEEAKKVLNDLRAVIRNNGYVSVGTYLEYARVKTIAEDFNYGWNNLDNILLQDTGELPYRYRMDLPSPLPIRSQRRDIYI